MDSATYSCDIYETFTMRVFECEDLSTTDEFTVLKAEKLDLDNNLEELNENCYIGKEDAIIERRKTIEVEIGADDDDPQLEKQSISALGEKFQSRPPDEQILTHTENSLLELNRNQHPSNHKVFNAQPEKNINLQSQSKLSKEVNLFKCVNCNFDFRRKVSLRSHSSLNNKENAFKCGFCNKEPHTTGIVSQNAVKRSRTQTYTKDFKCYQCNEIFLPKSSPYNHLPTHENKKSYECPVCSTKFTRKCNLLTHACKVLKSQQKVQDISKFNTNQLKKVLKKSTNKTFMCSECGKKFSKNWNLYRHSFTHSSVKQKKRYRCSECGKKFIDNWHLNRHSFTHCSVKQNENSKSRNKTFGCLKCDKKFRDKSNLNRHNLTHSRSRVRSFECHFCDKSKANQPKKVLKKTIFPNFNLQAQNSKSRNKTFRCSECGKKFSSKSNRSRHTRLTHSSVKQKKRYRCSECGKKFIDNWHLNRHTRLTHSSEKQKKRFRCSECGKKFIDNWHLNRHSFTHSSVKQNENSKSRNKSFGCSECDKKFVDKLHLNRQSLTHSCVKQIKNSKSRNKTFGCSECGKKFSAKSKLNRHNLTHFGVKPLECHYCNKGFLQKDYLRQHISTHTGEKPYKCKQCNVKFVFGSSLSKHIQRFHLKANPKRTFN